MLNCEVYFISSSLWIQVGQRTSNNLGAYIFNFVLLSYSGNQVPAFSGILIPGFPGRDFCKIPGSRDFPERD